MGLDNPLHIAFLLILLLLVFGAKRLPEMGRSLGSGLRGFKDSLSGEGLQGSLPSQTHPAEATTGAGQSAPPAPPAVPVAASAAAQKPGASAAA
jgi:sec-independent protein translocase protein TatA